MADKNKETIPRTYDINEAAKMVVCHHVASPDKKIVGESVSYEVTSTHDFSNLSMRALLKVASMQCKIKRKNEMGLAAHEHGTTEFTYVWTDADIDGARKSATPSVKGMKQVHKMSKDELAEFIEMAQARLDG